MVATLDAPTRPLRGGDRYSQALAGRKPWYRLYHRDSHTPDGIHYRNFGPIHRFDHHSGSPGTPADCALGRGVVYLAESLGTAGSEVFGDERVAGVCPNTFVAVVQPTGPVTVLDLTGAGIMAIGATAGLASGYIPRTDSQAWAVALHEDADVAFNISGLLYRGAHDYGPCLALWERAGRLELAKDVHGMPIDLALQISSEIQDLFNQEMVERRVVVEHIDEADCAKCQANI